MKIVVAYKWTRDPEESTVGADGTVDWSRAKPGLSAYDPVAIELARRLAEATGAELIGVTAGAAGVGAAIASKAVLSRGLDRTVIIEDDSLKEAGRAELAAVLAGAVRHIGDVDLVVTGDSSVDAAGRGTRLACGGGGQRSHRRGGHAAGAARHPGRRPGAGGLRAGRLGGGRGCRGAAGARHEGPPRGGQEASRAP
jgi:Electron transfer flavoprotein domain